jgi:cytochrome c oxidase assembly protein subunit 15
MHESAAPSRNEISAAAVTIPAPRTGDRRGLRRLAGGFLALVALTIGLVVLGALVRANHAGLACPDWPLCFGEFIPRMNLEIAFEWTHRLIAGAVSLAFVALAVQALRRPDVPRSAEILLAVATGLLATQVLLGALTVWLRIAPWTVTAHLIIGNGFSLTLLLIACSLRDAARERPARPPAPLAARRLVLVSAALLLLQMLLGGLVSSRYAGPACPEWPTCNGGVWIPTWSGNVGLHLLHRLNGYALLAVLAATAATGWRDPGLRRLTSLALALGLGEVLAGVANVWLGIPAEITGLHTGLAAALVLTLTLALRDVLTRAVPST